VETQTGSELLLDVSGAFDNVSHPRLLHNLRKRKIDIKMVKWVGSFLSDRTTTLALPEYKAEPSEVHTGIPQGSPLSPILYLFYNADLLEDCAGKTVSTLGYIDDVSLLATGDTVQHNTRALKIAYKKAEDWARKHGSVFATAKYTLVHFTRNPKVNTQHPLRLPEITITPTPSCRYLGVQMDSKLDWRDHVQRIQQRANKRLTALSSLASSTWGANLVTLRQVYQAMILPQILYGCSTWYKSRPYRAPGKPHLNKSRLAHALAPIQRRAAQIITGAFRTMAANAVEIESYLLPLDQQMEKTSFHSALRIISSPLYKSAGLGHKDSKDSPLSHHTAELRRRYQINYIKLERRYPHIITPWWRPPKITIDVTPEDAILNHKEICMSNGICLYTDGSGINGHVGSAAVVLRAPDILDSAILHKQTSYMGSDTESTVYAAELQGIYLALCILETSSDYQHSKATIFTDNQLDDPAQTWKHIRTVYPPEGPSPPAENHYSRHRGGFPMDTRTPRRPGK
jgi:hypothetical protein